MIGPFTDIGGTVEIRDVNAQPGAVFWSAEGGILDVWVLEIRGGRAQAIRTILNPDTPRHLGEVADIGAVVLARTRQAGTKTAAVPSTHRRPRPV